MRGAVDREAQGGGGGVIFGCCSEGHCQDFWSREGIGPVRYCSCLGEENALRCGTLLCFFLWPAFTGTDYLVFHAVDSFLITIFASSVPGPAHSSRK